MIGGHDDHDGEYDDHDGHQYVNGDDGDQDGEDSVVSTLHVPPTLLHSGEMVDLM